MSSVFNFFYLMMHIQMSLSTFELCHFINGNYGPIWLKFELIQNSMYVLITCKFKNQRTNGPVKAHLILGQAVSDKKMFENNCRIHV